MVNRMKKACAKVKNGTDQPMVPPYVTEVSCRTDKNHLKDNDE